jgi:hypothetical protein
MMSKRHVCTYRSAVHYIVFEEFQGVALGAAY